MSRRKDHGRKGRHKAARKPEHRHDHGMMPGDPDTLAKSFGFKSYGAYLMSDMAKTIATKVLGHINYCRGCSSQEKPTRIFHSVTTQAIMAGSHTDETSVLCEQCFGILLRILWSRGFHPARIELKHMINKKRHWMDQCKKARNQEHGKTPFREGQPEWASYSGAAPAIKELEPVPCQTNPI